MVKRFMRKEVREFCGHFPMFRLQEMDLDLAADLKNTHLGRTRLGNYNRIGQNAHGLTLMILIVLLAVSLWIQN